MVRDGRNGGLLSLLLVGTIGSCAGDNVQGHEEDLGRDSNVPSDTYNPDESTINRDGSIDGDLGVSPDGGDGSPDADLGIPDEVVPDEGTENQPPIVDGLSIAQRMGKDGLFFYNYGETNGIRRGNITYYRAEVSDPEGETVDDGLECRFEFTEEDAEVYTRDWRDNCLVGRAINDNGDYNLRIRVRDSEGLEGEHNVGLRVVDNVLPVAKAGPDLNLDVEDVECVIWDYEACDERNNICEDGPFAPGHGMFGTGSFDPDGEIADYRTIWDFENNPLVGFMGPCGTLGYSRVGEYTLRLVVRDNEGAGNFDDANVLVE